MSPVILGPATLHLGDCIEVMRAMPDNSVDSIVTDPPYHLTTGKKGGTGPASVNLESPHGRARIGTGFMGMKWDGGDIAQSVEMWTEALRILKPGGHLLAFSGSRTYHRMTCAIEDAGFEVRDQIMWVYGSGFPKSLNVSKAIDKAAGAERDVVGVSSVTGARSNSTIDDGKGYTKGRSFQNAEIVLNYLTEPATDAARQWDGWGTALKPAHEPICVARKPLAKGMTVAANVLTHGTGAMNIDGCRIGTDTRTYKGGGAQPSKLNNHGTGDTGIGMMDGSGKDLEFTVSGRWPANIIHDGSDEVVTLFPTKASGNDKRGQCGGTRAGGFGNVGADIGDGQPNAAVYADAGSAARFFYCAKASRTDRNEGLIDPGPQFEHGATLRKIEDAPKTGNTHPTVKPTNLMAYLCRMVTPPGGIVLDPFAGSGSTGKACVREGFHFIGIDMNADYIDIATARIAFEIDAAQCEVEQGELLAPAVAVPRWVNLDLFTELDSQV